MHFYFTDITEKSNFNAESFDELVFPFFEV